MKLLEQVYQQEHHQTKTLPLKELQDPQVILRCAGYSLFPCLRIPYINRQGERAASTDLIALSEGWVTTVRAAAESQGHSSLSHLTRRQRDNRVLQAKRLQAWKVEPNWQETGGSGSATARQGGTICQPGQMSNNQVERQQGSQGRGSYQMKSQERLQGSTVQLEELK